MKLFKRNNTKSVSIFTIVLLTHKTTKKSEDHLPKLRNFELKNKFIG